MRPLLLRPAYGGHPYEGRHEQRLRCRRTGASAPGGLRRTDCQKLRRGSTSVVKWGAAFSVGSSYGSHDGRDAQLPIHTAVARHLKGVCLQDSRGRTSCPGGRSSKSGARIKCKCPRRVAFGADRFYHRAEFAVRTAHWASALPKTPEPRVIRLRCLHLRVGEEEWRDSSSWGHKTGLASESTPRVFRRTAWRRPLGGRLRHGRP